MSSYKSAKLKVFNFFENPQGLFAQLIHVLIIVLIILSAVLLVIEYRYEELYTSYSEQFLLADNIILAVFTVEFLLRVWAAPKRGKFFCNFYNLIDLMAIVPMYLQFTNFQALRSLRILRAMRIFRVFRIFRFQKMFGDLFSLKDTVLERILPVIIK
jgi:voltage-gated potassium channel